MTKSYSIFLTLKIKCVELYNLQTEIYNPRVSMAYKRMQSAY